MGLPKLSTLGELPAALAAGVSPAARRGTLGGTSPETSLGMLAALLDGGGGASGGGSGGAGGGVGGDASGVADAAACPDDAVARRELPS